MTIVRVRNLATRPSRLSCAAILLAAMSSAGCYHAHILTYGQPANSSPWKATIDLAAEPAPTVPVPLPGGNSSSGMGRSCEENGMQHVEISTTFGSALGSLVGARAPADAQWQCRPKPPFVGPTGLAGAAVSGQPAAPASGRRTVSSLAWGALQTNVTPPPEKAPLPPDSPPTPANCGKRGMSTVTVSRNFGDALLTALTLGFLAPMQVAWQCAGEKSHAGQ